MAGPISIRIAEDPAHPEGGHAIVELRGIGSYRGDGSFILRRAGFQENHLAPGGWTVAETVLHPLGFEAGEDSVRLYLGPELVDHLEFGTPVEIQLGGSAIQGKTTWPDIAPLYDAAGARGRAVSGVGRATQATGPAPGARMLSANEQKPQPPKPAEPPKPLTAEPQPVLSSGKAAPIPPKLPPEPAGKSRSNGMIAAALLLAVAVLGSAGYWYFTSRAAPPGSKTATAPMPPAQEAKPAAPEAKTETPAPQQPSPNGNAPTPNETLKQQIAGKSPAEIGTLAKDYLARGDYNNALPLYFEAARQGDAPTMAAIAHMYDPNGFQADKPFSKPNPRQAAKWYADAVEKGDKDAEPDREKLKAWLGEQSQKGDADAAEILKEFWK